MIQQIDWVEELEKKKKAEKKYQNMIPGYTIKYHSTDKNGNIIFEMVPPYENYEHYKLYHDTDTNTAA